MLKVLLVEDDPEDAELIERQMRSERLVAETKRVGTQAEFLIAIDQQTWDVVLADYTLPQFTALDILQILKRRKSQVPVILVTGTLSEERAVEFIKEGGEDFILKSSLKRLGTAIAKALERKAAEQKRKRAEEALRSSHAQLRALAAKLQSLRESEAIRIAREIHDQLGQGLTAIKIELSRVADKLEAKGEPLAERLQAIVDLTNATIESVQKLVTELRPRLLDELGLAEAIRWQVQEFQQRTGIRCRFVSGLASPRLPGEIATAAFRIFQETLTNVARHAQATRVNIILKTTVEGLQLVVRDYGGGIQPSEAQNPASLGILGMRERTELLGGCFIIRGTAGKGTKVTVTLPLGLPSNPSGQI